MAIGRRDETWRNELQQRFIEFEDCREVFERAALKLEQTLGYDLDVLGFSCLDDLDVTQLIESIREYEQEHA